MNQEPQAAGTPPCCLPTSVADDALCFVFVEGEMLVRANGSGRVGVPHPADLKGLQQGAADRSYLGRLGDVPCWAVDFIGLHQPPEGLVLRRLRSLLDELSPDLAGQAVRASQILHWRRTHRRCGRCGAPLADRAEAPGRLCARCGLATFPRLSPAVIVAVLKGEEILLARSPRFPDGLFSLLAGFLEPGETLEACLHREVREEVGVEIDNLRYVGSQPWPFPDSLMIGFLADYAGGEIRIDGVEIVEAHWFGRDRLPPVPSQASIAGQIIAGFQQGSAGRPITA